MFDKVDCIKMFEILRIFHIHWKDMIDDCFRVSDIRFADDQGMVASTEDGLQWSMSKLNDTAKTNGMKINVQKQRQWYCVKTRIASYRKDQDWDCSKTKTMVVRWDGGGVVNITVEEQGIKQIKSLKCLGSVITVDRRSHIYKVISQRPGLRCKGCIQ